MNANYRLLNLLNLLLDKGDTVPSRNGETKELTFRSFEVSDVVDRYITLGERRVSVPAQIAETMWVLAGRNDVGWLSAYLPQAPTFADDGEHWRGGYGPTLRSGAVDQLKFVIKLLKDEPTTRRAVISLWDTERDTQPGKDIPCLAGETILWSPEGDLPISEVAAKFESGEVDRWPVFSVDPATRTQKIEWATNVWKSGVKPTIRLTFDDGSSLRLTPDHRLYIKHRKSHVSVSEILAGDLRIGDRVLATHQDSDANGYKRFKRELGKNTSYNNMVKVHREYAELLHGPLLDNDVHHQNEVKSDNRASNLQILSHADHSALKMFGERNPMVQMEPEKRALKGQAHSVALTGRKHHPESIQKMRTAGLAREAAKRDNHVVVSVEEDETVPVFDFTVPGSHTALVGTGVVAHNCNDWLHFLYRDNALHLNIAVRSNDVMWGWSGINFFEWSVLLEIVAKEAGMAVGVLNFNVSSLHLYERHYAKAQRIIDAPQTGLATTGTPVRPVIGLAGFLPAYNGDLDRMLRLWFRIEDEIREGATVNIKTMPDPLFRSWLWAIAYYWGFETEALEALEHMAIVEALELSPKRGAKVIDTHNLVSHMIALHNQKSTAYGNSWKKRGEVFSIIPNVARKVDRILANTETDDETRLDTAMDLVVYLAKYTLWLEIGDRADTSSENHQIGHVIRMYQNTNRNTVLETTFESMLLEIQGRSKWKNAQSLLEEAVGYLVKLYTGPEGRAIRNV